MSPANLSRRNLVASAAALPALAVPVAAAANNADAEILRLGAALEEVEQVRAAQLATDRETRAIWEAACERAGLPRREIEDFPSRDEWHEYVKTRLELNPRREKEGAEDQDGNTAWDRIVSRLGPLAEQILSLRATTPAGFAVQVRAFLLAVPDLFDGDSYEMMFAEAAASFVGIRDAKQITDGV